MCLSRDGNFLLAGEIDTSLQFDVAVTKVTPEGNLIFAKRINLITTGNFGNYPNAIYATNDSGFILTGFTDYPGFPYGDNALALKTDLNCNVPKLVSISNSSTIFPEKFVINQNYPNPFNPFTKIDYTLRVSSEIQLIIYDILGRKIKILVNERQTPGKYNVIFNGQELNLSSGIYFYQLIAENYSETRKMVYTK